MAKGLSGGGTINWFLGVTTDGHLAADFESASDDSNHGHHRPDHAGQRHLVPRRRDLRRHELPALPQRHARETSTTVTAGSRHGQQPSAALGHGDRRRPASRPASSTACSTRRASGTSPARAAQIGAGMSQELTSGTGLTARYGMNEGAGTAVGQLRRRRTRRHGRRWPAVGRRLALHAAAAAERPAASADARRSAGRRHGVATDPHAVRPGLRSRERRVSTTFFGREAAAATAPDFTIVALPDTQHYVDNPARTSQLRGPDAVDRRHAGCAQHRVRHAPRRRRRARRSVRGRVAARERGDGDARSSRRPQQPDDGQPRRQHDDRQRHVLRPVLPAEPIHRQQLVRRLPRPARRRPRQPPEQEQLRAVLGRRPRLHHPAPRDTTCRASPSTGRNRILDQYPDRKAIITTHLFVNTSNQRGTTPARAHRRHLSRSGLAAAVRPHCNVFLVLNGHYPGEGRRTDNNACGEPVHQLLSDYQERTNGGDGWLRIMNFKPSENKIDVQTFSPTRTAAPASSRPTPNSQFSLDVDLAGGAPFEADRDRHRDAFGRHGRDDVGRPRGRDRATSGTRSSATATPPRQVRPGPSRRRPTRSRLPLRPASMRRRARTASPWPGRPTPSRTSPATTSIARPRARSAPRARR